MDKDKQIIHLMAAQDFSGLEFLIDEYSSSLYKTIYSILSYPEERAYVEDVMNEILYEICQKITRYDETKSSFQTWMLMIARNRSIYWKRKLVRERTVTDENVTIPTDSELLEKENFLALVDHLSDIDQEIFLYYYFYQFSAKEIAEMLAVSVEIIFNRLSRGRKTLRELEEKKDGKL